MAATKDKLLSPVIEAPITGCNKISIIGAGNVGMACAITLLSKRISTEICLIDKDENKVMGEVLDLQHGVSFAASGKITGGTDFTLTSHSRICIITAGDHVDDKSKLLEQNAAIIREVVPQIVRSSPHCIILVATDPHDILTYLAWKLSCFPKSRVFGFGTSLDSSRFRFLISERLKVAPSSCEALIIGERGCSSVAVWSAVTVGGVSLRDIDGCIGIDEDEDHWEVLHCEVKDAGAKVACLKGYTNWAIGLCCASIVESILMNTGKIIPLSTSAQGLYDIDMDIFLSLPCVVNANGITSVVKLNLTPYEESKLKASANVINDTQKCFKI